MQTHRKGDYTEAIVIAELKRREIPVSVPFGDNERYDLVVEAPDQSLYRVQVKTGWLRDGTVRFKGISQHTNASGNTYERYDDGIDAFLAYCHEIDSLYWVWVGEVGHKVHLRVAAPEQDQPSINWAEEYEFDRVWPPTPPGPSSGAPDVVQSVLGFLDDRGVTAAVPDAGDLSYDLLLEGPEGFVRVRVKPAYETDGRLRFNADERYDADYLGLFHAAEEELYLVDPDGEDGSFSLRLEPTVRDVGSRTAAEYEFDERWPPADGDE